jgi:predicted GIY-YIG superfamily endonuclease
VKESAVAAWVYILLCADKSYYTGVTTHLEQRLDQHERAITGYTAKRKPLTLAWTEEFANLDDAQAFEHQVKGWRRAKKEALIRGDWLEVQRLSRFKRKPDD